MSDHCIYILTGETGEGKTIALLKWAGKINGICGILSVVVDGRRFFLDLGSKEIFPMEAGADEVNTIAVGRFIFSRNSFDKAIQILRNGIGKCNWLVLDEAGPLELKSLGFYNVINEMIATMSKEQKILLVVRRSLVDDMIDHFGISRSDIVIINKASLSEERFA